jgi:hypothetical protein
MAGARRWGLAAFVTGASLLLAACLLIPGQFTASLDLRRDGSFTYRYDGEVVLLGLTRLIQAGREANATFKPEPCHAEETQATHPCTSSELDSQRQAWERARAARAERDRQQAEQMKAMLGGIDPTDPKSAADLADRLRRQAGWKRVEYKGDGVYLVSFEASGRLTHDFTFPTVERLPMANAFVTVVRRADGTVRIDAPGFGPPGLSPMMGMMGALGGKDAKAAALPTPNGRFTITTDGTVLANNTDEGPHPAAGGQVLEWQISQRTPAMPTALVKLGQ